MTLTPHKPFFGFSVMVYNVGVMGMNIHLKILVLEGLVFMLLVTSKLKLKDFSSYSKYHNVIHEYSLKATKTFL